MSAAATQTFDASGLPTNCAAQPKLTNAEYHAHEAISNSKLKVFRESRKRYYEQFIAKTLAFEQTPAMLLGSLVHALTLEPENVNSLYAVAPKCDRRTNVGKAEWESFCNGVPAGAEIVDAVTFETANRISRELQANDCASQLLGLAGPTEHPIFWIDQITGLPCRAKLDKLAVAEDLIIDIKTRTDASPGGFARAVVNLGYSRQAAWYLDGHKRLTGADANFIFIAVETKPPFEIGFYELGESEIDRAREQNKRLVDALAFCQFNNAWQSIHETEVVKLSIPKYAQFEDEYVTY